MDAATLFDAVSSAEGPAEAPLARAAAAVSNAPTTMPVAPVVLVAPRSVSPGDTPSLDRSRVLEGILRVNRTVAREFLDQFKDDSLRRYLAHLESAERPRDRHAHWTRPGDSPSIIGRESAL